MRLSAARCSHRGQRVRNEDYLDFCGNESIGCFALADGAGGHRGGALAAEAVVKETLSTFLASPDVSRESARSILTSARAALQRARAANPDLSDMNTTLAVLLIDVRQGRACWTQLGDTRIYLFRNGRARILTRDHSVLQALIDAGMKGGREVHDSLVRNTLYASVGSDPLPPQAVCDQLLEVRQGDIFLLCTDGFWDALDETTMESMLLEAPLPEQWVERMAELIEQQSRDGQDNFSAFTVWVGERLEVTRRLPVREPQQSGNDEGNRWNV